MSRLLEHQQALYELRFSPMCRPAAEVANFTQLESHSVRSRTMIMWRVCAGHLTWGPREVELLYESTLDSISEAFDVFHYPVSQYMLDARADVWEAGLAPQNVKDVVSSASEKSVDALPKASADVLLLGGEIAQAEGADFSETLTNKLPDIPLWVTPSGVLPYVLGAQDIARAQAEVIVNGIQESGAKTVIADGPETAWGLTKVFPTLGVDLPNGVQVQLLSDYLEKNVEVKSKGTVKTMVHDSRPACLIADELPNHLAVMPGYLEDEAVFGKGLVFDAPRQIVDALGGERVYGAWTRCLAKTCGADDGLWLTYPDLAKGLAWQRLAYAKELGAEKIVADSPLCAAYLSAQAGEDDPAVYWLPELVLA